MIYNINGHEVDCIVISELAYMCGRATTSLKKLESRGILPQANFRGPDIEMSGGMKPGNRLYTRELAEKLAEVFKNEISQGKAVTDETKTKIIQLFAEERNKLA